jgi:hypothetical protein
MVFGACVYVVGILVGSRQNGHRTAELLTPLQDEKARLLSVSSRISQQGANLIPTLLAGAWPLVRWLPTKTFAEHLTAD